MTVANLFLSKNSRDFGITILRDLFKVLRHRGPHQTSPPYIITKTNTVVFYDKFSLKLSLNLDVIFSRIFSEVPYT